MLKQKQDHWVDNHTGTVPPIQHRKEDPQAVPEREESRLLEKYYMLTVWFRKLFLGSQFKTRSPQVLTLPLAVLGPLRRDVNSTASYERDPRTLSPPTPRISVAGFM